MPIFHVRQRRAETVSVLLTLAAHALLILLLVSSVLLRAANQPQPLPARVKANISPVASLPPMKMVKVVKPPPMPGAPGGLDPAIYRRLAWLGVKDPAKLSPAEARRRLAELSRRSLSISDQSLADIAAFLGAPKRATGPRTNYRPNELNPNANFVRSEVTRAERYDAGGGQPGYRITLADHEQDRFTFTLTGRPARELEKGGLKFGGKPLAGSGKTAAAAFELKGAGIKGIRRWKRPEDPVGMKGAIVIMEDASGRQRTFHLAGKSARPFCRERRRFRRGPTGKYIYDPDDETTIDRTGIDSSTLVFWKAKKVKSRKPGVTRARVVQLDAQGERYIFFMEGPEAENLLAQTEILRANPALQRVYEKANIGGLLLQMLQQQQRPRRKRRRVAKKQGP